MTKRSIDPDDLPDDPLARLNLLLQSFPGGAVLGERINSAHDVCQTLALFRPPPVSHCEIVIDDPDDVPNPITPERRDYLRGVLGLPPLGR